MASLALDSPLGSEDGLWAGSAPPVTPTNTPIRADFVTALAKGRKGGFALKGGDAQSGRLRTLYDGVRPRGYEVMHKRGAIVLGVGGDNSDAAVGTFYEGFIAAGWTSDAADDAVQANIVAARYSRAPPSATVRSDRTRTSHALNSTSANLNSTRVFYDGLSGVPNYRIPAIIQTASGHLVAFAECRHGGDQSASQIAARTSEDGGVTWSQVVFAAGATDSPATRASCAANRTHCRVGNPAVVYDTVTRRVVLLMVTRGFEGGEDALGNSMTTSADAGYTWSPPRDVSDEWGAAAGSLPGRGTALQLSDGPHAGRLLVVSHHSAYQRDFVSLSDDHGASWRTIDSPFPKMDEAAITQLPNGSVLLNMRHQHLSPQRGRGVALSTDDGETFGPITYDATLISPVCQASIVSFDGAVYFSNPASRSRRDHLTIRRSTDSAATWSAELLVEEAASAGYSCLVKGRLAPTLHEGQPMGGLLYEAAAGDIRFARFPLAFPES